MWERRSGLTAFSPCCLKPPWFCFGVLFLTAPPDTSSHVAGPGCWAAALKFGPLCRPWCWRWWSFKACTLSQSYWVPAPCCIVAEGPALLAQEFTWPCPVLFKACQLSSMPQPPVRSREAAVVGLQARFWSHSNGSGLGWKCFFLPPGSGADRWAETAVGAELSSRWRTWYLPWLQVWLELLKWAIHPLIYHKATS